MDRLVHRSSVELQGELLIEFHLGKELYHTLFTYDNYAQQWPVSRSATTRGGASRTVMPESCISVVFMQGVYALGRRSDQLLQVRDCGHSRVVV
jgi:hypothetical protein